ncbi:hypothetical protein ACFLYA_01215 [Candidatus Dependentiae bacterium]
MVKKIVLHTGISLFFLLSTNNNVCMLSNKKIETLKNKFDFNDCAKKRKTWNVSQQEMIKRENRKKSDVIFRECISKKNNYMVLTKYNKKTGRMFYEVKHYSFSKEDKYLAIKHVCGHIIAFIPVIKTELINTETLETIKEFDKRVSCEFDSNTNQRLLKIKSKNKNPTFLDPQTMKTFENAKSCKQDPKGKFFVMEYYDGKLNILDAKTIRRSKRYKNVFKYDFSNYGDFLVLKFLDGTTDIVNTKTLAKKKLKIS